jgi:hypothetical protein
LWQILEAVYIVRPFTFNPESPDDVVALKLYKIQVDEYLDIWWAPGSSAIEYTRRRWETTDRDRDVGGNFCK